MARYVVAVGLILGVAVGGAGLDYHAAANPRYLSSCMFYVGIIPSQAIPGSPDTIKAYVTVVVGAVQAAKLGGALAAAAPAGGISPGALAGETEYVPQSAIGLVIATVVDPKKDRTVALANAVCTQTVATIQKQRQDSLNIQISASQERLRTIQAELKTLQKIPAKKRTVSDVASIRAQTLALDANTVLIARLMSSPPDRIYVVRPAAVANPYDPRSLSKYLLFGLAVGVFLAFLYVLVAEAILDSRRKV